MKKDHKANASSLVKVIKDCLDIDVAPQTVRNYPHNNRFKVQIARKKSYIYKKNRVQRLEFARKYANKPVESWHCVILADERKFNFFEGDDKIILYRKSNALSWKNEIRCAQQGMEKEVKWFRGVWWLQEWEMLSYLMA
ncbi:hypothetical protein TNCV_70371 [Trichonephila clavipes]|nr:hypothetical protein TNCV_70371 [Trichonephila clavipes]